MSKNRISAGVVLAILTMVTVLTQSTQAQGARGNATNGVGALRNVEVLNADTPVVDPSSGMDRLTCSRIDNHWLDSQTLRFSIGFPEVEALGRPGRAQGSWTIRGILHTAMEQVTGYDFDGKFNASGQTLSGGTFTLVGTADYVGSYCARSTPPPVMPSARTPIDVTIQGTCGTNQNVTFEARDSNGPIATGTFKANITCSTNQNFSAVNNNVDRH